MSSKRMSPTCRVALSGWIGLTLLFTFEPADAAKELAAEMDLPLVTVSGIYRSADEKVVIIQTKDGTIKIPRSHFKDVSGYIAGRAKVTVDVPLLEVIRLNQNRKPTKKPSDGSGFGV